MTNDTISRCRAYQAHQCNSYLVEANPLHGGGGLGADTALWCFHATGIPLYPPSTENTGHIARSRAEGGLYRKTSQDSGRSNTGTGKIQREINQPHCHTSLGGLSQEDVSWLKPNIRYRCFTALTDWVPKKSPRPIVFWFQTMGAVMIRNHHMYPVKKV